MKQLSYETSDYKNKEDIKTFVTSFNDLADKYVKSFESSDSELNKINGAIEKKETAIIKLDSALVDLNKKTEELSSLKEFSSNQIKELEEKKSEINFTDSEVQKMELDDINSQISSKKSKISKIDTKINSTKTKIKTSTEDKKTALKELKELNKNKLEEESNVFKTQSILTLINETKEELNKKVLEIINAPYKRPYEEELIQPVEPEARPKEDIKVAPKVEPKVEVHVPPRKIAPLKAEAIEFDMGSLEPAKPVVEKVIVHPAPLEEKPKVEEKSEIVEEPIIETDSEFDTLDVSPIESSFLELNLNEEQPEPVQEEPKVEEKAVSKSNSILEDKFKAEGINFDDFSTNAKEKMLANEENVLSNIELLKKHGVPLEYSVDQSEIFYDITPQDLDDLLSIITVDDEGNGMGFSIDFTFNILTELTKINIDDLIDVYNEEFMNVNAKTGVISLLKLTNPKLTDFEKNRRINVEILKTLGANNVDEIVEKYPEFVNIDNPLFINLLNLFDKKDLINKINDDITVVPKILEYWKNN